MQSISRGVKDTKTHQTNIKELVGMMAQSWLISCHLCDGQKAALEHATKIPLHTTR